MALVFEDDGVIWDDETGETISSALDREIQEAAAKYVWGRVLEIGLGNGLARAAIIATGYATKVHTIESRGDLIDLWTAQSGASNLPSSTIDADLTLDEGDGLDAITTPGMHVDSLFLDVAGAELDPDWIDAIHITLADAGARVVVISTDPEYAMPGFAGYRMEGPGPGGAYAWVLDRYDPDNGVGTARTEVWVPGQGFMDPGGLGDLEG